MKKQLILLVFSFVYSLNLISQEYLKEFVSISKFTKGNNHSFFVANDGIHGEELWKTDGTKEGTTLVSDIYVGANSSSISNLFYFKNNLYFSANDGIHGQELWKSDGTKEGTVLVKNIYQFIKQSSIPSNFTLYNNELYFLAADDNISGYKDLWKTDGTEAGTFKVHKMDKNYGRVSNLTATNSFLYVTLGYGSLYKTNGIQDTLTKVDVDDYYSLAEFNEYNNELYFISHTSYRQSIRFYKIDKNDNLILLQEYNQPGYGSIDIDNFTYVNGTVYFSVRTNFDSQDDTDVLWKTDGTLESTQPIKSFSWISYYSNSYISNFTEYNGNLYFSGSGNYALWVSNGTVSGTKTVLGTTTISSDVKMFVYNNSLYFKSGSNFYFSNGNVNDIHQAANIEVSSKNYEDFFNVAVGHNSIYFEGFTDNDSEATLFIIKESPLMELKESYAVIKNNQLVNLNSKIDSLVSKTYTITNKGDKDLVLSSITIQGNSFFIKNTSDKNISQENTTGIIDQIIKPGDFSSFQIGFYPHKLGIQEGALQVKSNDSQYFNYNINFTGTVEEGDVENKTNDFPLEKEITFENSTFVLSENNILENNVLGSVIGRFFTLDNISYSYSFVTGKADNNNQDFIIEENQLKANKVFNYQLQNTLSIRVKATPVDATKPALESVFVIEIVNENETVSQDCSENLVNLSFGLKDVAFVNANTIIAVGDFGKILKSTNAGETWKNVGVDITSTLYKIQFVSDTVAYIKGANILLKTVDAGENWFTVSFPTESYPYTNNMFFVSETIGFVYGDEGKIYKTTDGGNSWIFKSIGYSDLTCAYFFNENEGIFGLDSKAFVKTSDGGLNFETISVNLSELNYSSKIIKIDFVDDKNGYAATYNGEILKTTDGGSTWVFKGKTNVSYPTKLTFLDENIGYFIGGFNTSYILKTEDGGVTWTSLDFDRVGAFTSVGFYADKAIIVGHGEGFGSTSQNGHSIYKMNVANDQIELISSLAGDAYYVSMDFSDNLGLLLSSNQYSGNKDSRMTKNGGLTWQKINLPEVQSEAYFECYIKNNKFYILGRYNIYVSSDFGESFETIENPDLLDLFWADDAVYGTSYQNFYKSLDSGLTWVKNPNLSYDEFSKPNDIYFINDNTGYLLAYNGYYKTTDGGENFTFKDITVEKDQGSVFFRSIFFKDELNGIIGNGDGLIYRTSNGGNTWQRVVSTMSVGVTELESNLSDYYAISTNGGGYTALNKSNGNGNSWKTVGVLGGDIKDLKFFNNELYLIGDRGVFYKYTNNKKTFLPGLIQGETEVAIKSTVSYSIVQNANTSYQWSVSGNNNIEYTNNESKVTWQESGQFILSVSAYTDCEKGETREIIVNVYDRPNPTIVGANEVLNYTTENYYTGFNTSSRYLWSIEGSESFVADENNIEINWGEIGEGKITVTEVDNITNTRARSNFKIAIKEVLALENLEEVKDISVYPVPSKNSIKIEHSSSFKISEKNIKIYDLLGKEQYLQVEENDYLNISNLKPGVYLLKISIDSKVYFKKMIKSE